MRRFIVIVVAITAVSSAAASAATAEGAGARRARPARTVTLQRWVRSVCGGLSDWSGALDRLDTKIQKGLTDLDSGKLSPKELQAISQKSCGVLREMGPQIQWVQSYVTDDRVYCVYIAPNEEAVRKHAQKGGFPANRISQIRTVIDPTTAD